MNAIARAWAAKTRTATKQPNTHNTVCTLRTRGHTHKHAIRHAWCRALWTARQSQINGAAAKQQSLKEERTAEGNIQNPRHPKRRTCMPKKTQAQKKADRKCREEEAWARECMDPRIKHPAAITWEEEQQEYYEEDDPEYQILQEITNEGKTQWDYKVVAEQQNRTAMPMQTRKTAQNKQKAVDPGRREKQDATGTTMRTRCGQQEAEKKGEAQDLTQEDEEASASPKESSNDDDENYNPKDEEVDKDDDKEEETAKKPPERLEETEIVEDDTNKDEKNKEDNEKPDKPDEDES